MRVLVTGNLGYLGSAIVARLKADGHSVYGQDPGWYLWTFAQPPVLPHIQVGTDIRDAWPHWLEPQVIVHLAGLSNDPLGDIDPGLTWRINARATMDLIASNPVIRHVIVSSCAVYGMAGDKSVNEDSDTSPLTAYARAKLSVDHYAHPRYDAVSLRLGTVYGYAPGYRLDLVVNKMIHDAKQERHIRVLANAWRPLVHIEDVASAVAYMVTSPDRGIFNVAGGNYGVSEIAELIAEQFPGTTADWMPNDADNRSYSVNTDRIRNLGWTPQRTPAGFAFEMRDRDYPPNNYRRIDALRSLLVRGVLTSDLRLATQAAEEIAA